MVPLAAVAMMLKHSVVVAALVLEYQVVAVEVTLVTVFVDDESAVAAEAVVGAAVAVVAAQPVNNHISHHVTLYAIKTHWGVEVYLHAFLTSALVEKLSVSCPGCFIHGVGNHWHPPNARMGRPHNQSRGFREEKLLFPI